jgi:hypothetical protein
MSADNLVLAFSMMLGIQFLHSIEELSTGFHRKWYLFAMPFPVFLAFEIAFLSFWIAILLLPDFPHRTGFMMFFNLLMFANGIQHLVWAAAVKRYVPGLVTAPLFLIAFLWAYTA